MMRELKEDLESKLSHLRSLVEQPGLFVTEHFYEMRSRVDYDAGRVLGLFYSRQWEDDDKQVTELNRVWAEFIRILKLVEEEILQGLRKEDNVGLDEAVASLSERVERFGEAACSDDDLDDAYAELALAIVEETYRVERRVLGERTVIFLPSLKPEKLGTLVYLPEDYLNQNEIASLKLVKYQQKFLKEIHDATLSSLNATLLVDVVKPFVLNKNIIIIGRLVSSFVGMEDSSAKFFFMSKSTEPRFGYAAEESNICLREPDKSNYALLLLPEQPFAQFIEDIESNEDTFKYFDLRDSVLLISVNRLKRLDSKLAPFFEKLTELCLDFNRLESLNEELLGKCVNLRTLQMWGACLPGTKFSIEFLASLKQLQLLFITLPEMPMIDFSPFANLDHLVLLELASERSLNGNIERPRLTKPAFIQLSAICHLTALRLSYFHIEDIDAESMRGFRELQSLTIAFSRLERVDSNTLKNCRLINLILRNIEMAEDLPDELLRDQGKMKDLCLKKCQLRRLNESQFDGLGTLVTLTLTGNSIDHLPDGVFDSLVMLQQLDLTDNRIYYVTAGLFDKLTTLEVLNLDFNPIKQIEANAFVRLKSLVLLSISQCGLRSINNLMFNGLTSLENLLLAHNRIEEIEVVVEEVRVNVVNNASANMTDEQMSLTKEHLFRDLKRLQFLVLSSNRLEKLDLNCFCNLSRLEELFLDNNSINELNQEAAPGSLAHLKVLNLNDNQLITMPKNAFAHSLELEILRMNKNKLERLDEGFFDPFRNLEIVNMSYNRLTLTITEATFAACRKLKELSILDNENVHIADGAFKGFDNLVCFCTNQAASIVDSSKSSYVYLENSCLDALEHLFTDKQIQGFAPALQSLKISTNQIKALSVHDSAKKPDESLDRPQTFMMSWIDNMKSLRTLSLVGNLIESLDEPSLFVSLPLLLDLSLASNRLKRIHRRALKGLSHLQNLDLSNNNLSNMDVDALRSLLNLKDLNLANNSISFLNLPRLSKFCKRLVTLNLSNNQLDNRTFNRDAMLASTYLVRLILANNQLQSMDFVQDLTELLKLDLSNNKIESLESLDGVNLLGRLMVLQNIDLSGNRIRTVREETFAHLVHGLHQLDLSSNPLDLNLDSILIEII